MTGLDARNLTATAKPRRRPSHGERGQALVELALSAPFMIMLLLGVIEFGRGLNSYLTILNAARDSARLAAQIDVTDTARLKSLIDGEISRLPNSNLPLSCTGASICITNGTVSGSNPVDKWVQVRVCYDHSVIVGIPWILDGPISMCSQTKIRIAA